MATIQERPTAAAQMAEACLKFVESLSPEQKARATFRYQDGERLFWYYPPLNRHGLPLRDMDSNQRQLAHALLSSGLTDAAYQRAVQIIEHESVLGDLEKETGRVTWPRDPELYSFTVFGEPGAQDPWGWRAEGHHISLNFSNWGDEVISTTPFFFGSNPAEVRQGPKKGLRILRAREDLAFELMNSLDSGQRSRVIIHDTAPYDILTCNSARAGFLREEGLPASRMSGTQKEILMALVTEYVSEVRADVSDRKLAALKEDGLDRLHLAWAGPVEMGKAHYYRIHGGNFVVEFDNQQNQATHIHSVLRDVANDFAVDVLTEHLLLYHLI